MGVGLEDTIWLRCREWGVEIEWFDQMNFVCPSFGCVDKGLVYAIKHLYSRKNELVDLNLQ